MKSIEDKIIRNQFKQELFIGIVGIVLINELC
jgi:hypothetical protein